MLKHSIYFIALLSLIFVSCADSLTDIKDPYEDGCGALKFALSVNNESQSKSSEIKFPIAEEFTIDITQGEESKYSALYKDTPISIPLEAGDYTVKATSGDNEKFTTEKPSYLAQDAVNIDIAHTTYLDLTAKMISYAVDIRYSEDFSTAFESFWVEVHIANLRFILANGGDQIGYLAAGDAMFVLKGTTKDGTPYSTVFKEISSQGAEHHILNLSIRPLGHSFELLVDAEVENLDFDKDVDPSLYPEMAAPVVGDMEFYETVQYNGTNAANSNVTIRPLTTVNDVTVQFTDSKFSSLPYLIAELDTEKVYSLSNSDDVALLTSAGVELVSGGIGENTAVLNFGKLAQALETQSGATTLYGIKIGATDKLIGADGEHKKISTDFNLSINPPKFTMPAINLGKVWSKEFSIEKVTSGNMVQCDFNVATARHGFTYQYSSNKTNWSDISSSMKVAGLTQNTNGIKYYVRALYNSTPSTNIIEFNTEATKQIPNNTFATYHTETRNGQPCYWFFTSGATAADQWWSTRNGKTTSEGIDAPYTRYSGARPTSGQGVELVTCGWGSGNTNGGYLSVVNNTWAGAIFLGSYSTDTYDNSKNEHHGKEFPSRPTAMTFDYTYAPYNNNDHYVAKIWLENRNGGTTTRLAYGESTSTSKQTSFKKQTIQLSYSNDQLPITHLCVAFYSGVNEYRKAVAYQNKTKRGSVFHVNNVTLVYGR